MEKNLHLFYSFSFDRKAGNVYVCVCINIVCFKNKNQKFSYFYKLYCTLYLNYFWIDKIKCKRNSLKAIGVLCRNHFLRASVRIPFESFEMKWLNVSIAAPDKFHLSMNMNYANWKWHIFNSIFSSSSSSLEAPHDQNEQIVFSNGGESSYIITKFVCLNKWSCNSLNLVFIFLALRA